KLNGVTARFAAITVISVWIDVKAWCFLCVKRTTTFWIGVAVKLHSLADQVHQRNPRQNAVLYVVERAAHWLACLKIVGCQMTCDGLHSGYNHRAFGPQEERSEGCEIFWILEG